MPIFLTADFLDFKLFKLAKTMEPNDIETRLKALEEENQILRDGHNRNRDRITRNQQGIKTSLAVLVFIAIVFGLPIAEVKWQGKDDFSFTRDTASPVNVIIGGLAAAALFLGDSPAELLNKLLGKDK